MQIIFMPSVSTLNNIEILSMEIYDYFVVINVFKNWLELSANTCSVVSGQLPLHRGGS